ncbi:MAG: choice-of-anchor E domain-containing protein [Methylovulum sp.]|uniref:choice-of-anchor E domain-containing protein n=1 Tax=Methylovulum sp. TaxID=1916980 RepID=UPI0026275C9F|nr:choice-of-anchor E domain-containing protein [Methylovulum sp.]MDD2724869.1 choice-of-anchor E domain-containing protein [Methylovulum sp.]MDD5125637.1 choice-of-anchor E domain-containing protein [Methylovulum sp.]
MNKYLLMASLALGSSSFATSSQALSLSGGSFTNAEQTTEINQTGLLNLFDSTLGILTGVTFTFTGSGTTSFNATNNAAQSQTFKIDSTVNLFYSSTNGAIQAALTTLSNPLVILTATTGFQTLGSSANASYGPFTDSDLLTTSAFGGFLGNFQNAGGGTFDVGCNSLSGVAVTGGGGNIATSQTTTAGCGASISYEYDLAPPPSLPAPTSLSLIGVGVAAFAALRRRKAA